MRLDLGFGASGIGDDTWEESRVRAHWAILAGAEARRKVYENVSRSDRKQGGSTVLRGTPKVTLRTALEFLFAEGIEAEQKKPGLLLVKPDEYAKAATRMSNRMRVQRLKQGLLFYWCVVASGLAASARHHLPGRQPAYKLPASQQFSQEVQMCLHEFAARQHKFM